MSTYGHPLSDFPGPCVRYWSLIPSLVQIRKRRVVDQLFGHVRDLSEGFPRQQPRLVQALRRQLDRVGDIGARVSFAVLIRVLHDVG